MAIIPKKESVREITTQPGLTLKSTDVAGVQGRAIQVISETIEKAAYQFMKAKSLAETTQAQTEASIKLNELQIEATTDPDIWNTGKYFERMGEIREKASKNITIPQARDNFRRLFDNDAIAADFNIRKTLRGRQMDWLQATMFDQLDVLGEQYVEAGSPEEKKYIEFKRDELLKKNIQFGVIDNVAARNYKVKLEKLWQESAIRNAIANDATLTKEMLLAGDFKDLTIVEVDKWVEQAEKKMKKNKKVAEEMALQDQTQEEGNLLTQVVDGLLTPKDIIELQAKGDISLEMAKTAQMIMLSADNVATRESDEVTFNGLINSYLLLKDGDLEALRKFRIKVGVAFSTGKLTHDDTALLVSRTIDPLVDVEIKKKQKGFFAMAVAAFKNWASVTSENPANALFLMTKELVNRIKDKNIPEENIEEESQAIIEDAKKVINPNRAQFKVGDIVNTPAGPREIVGVDIDGEPLVTRVK